MNRLGWKRFLFCVAFLLFIFCFSSNCRLLAQSVRVEFKAVPEDTVMERLKRVRSKDAEREKELKTMFDEAGCQAIEEQKVISNDPPNIICTLPGSTKSLIIVGAHFDHAKEGIGVVDDWSGASLLPSLYEGLKVSARKHTFLFVGFTDEEKGLIGSNYYVKHFPDEQLAAVKAMVNLECLGLTPTKVWAHVADPKLLNDLRMVGQSMEANLQPSNVEKVGNDDTQPFRDKKLPVITIHSITQETWPILHSAKDNISAIHPDDLFNSYRVILEYLTFIDNVLN